MFIEKATLDSGNPLIFNKEEMTYNQIKKRQLDLFDESGNAWICLYLANDYLTKQGVSTKEVEFKTQSVNVTVNRSEVPTSGYVYNHSGYLALNEKVGVSEYITKYYLSGRKDTTPTRPTDNAYDISASDRDQISLVVQGYNISNYVTGTLVQSAMRYNGTIVKEVIGSTTKYYRVTVTQTPLTLSYQFRYTDSLGIQIQNAVGRTAPTGTNTLNKVYVDFQSQTVTFTELSNVSESLYFNIQSATQVCKDAPYYLLYMPYSPNNINYVNNLDYAVNIAKALGEYCYDAQILPYAPEIRCRTTPLPTVSSDTANTLRIYSKSGSTQTTKGYIYCSALSSFEFELNHQETVPSEAVELKVAAETQFVRLNSPNGSGTFEFIPAKNNGINGFTVECTYKPISPYINICPKFGGLYGETFKDYRGLICQGDFSIPQINDSWVSYEQNNKNYLNIFNRQIENMEFTNKMQRIQQGVSIGVGALQGAVSGAAAGATMGLGGAGAIVGGVASLGAGIADFELMKANQREALDYTKDLFGYNLGNIQARPNTLSKTGSLIIDNHFVPYLEFYDCTDEEKEALRNKIKYNGMSVGVIGKMIDYMKNEPTYIKGKIIKIYNVDTHMSTAIAEELNKGVFI